MTTIELVALSAETFTPPSKMPGGAARRRRCGAGRGRRRRARGAARAGDDVVERLRELGRVRVLERQDVDLALAGLRDVDALDELEDAQVRALGRDDDERVRAIVGDDLRDVEVSAAPARRAVARAAAAPSGRRRGAAPPPLTSKSSLMRFSTSLAERVVDRLDQDLIAARADVDLLEDLHHAPDVRARCR